VSGVAGWLSRPEWAGGGGPFAIVLVAVPAAWRRFSGSAEPAAAVRGERLRSVLRSAPRDLSEYTSTARAGAGGGVGRDAFACGTQSCRDGEHR
jgi:hypothetical protein